MNNNLFLLSVLLLSSLTGCGQPPPAQPVEAASPTAPQTISKIIPAAEQPDLFLPLLANKRVAVFANNTSMVGDTHLVDTLLALGVKVQKIFAPEHGFRGNADAGEKVVDSKDPRTGVPIVSLYGKKRKPGAEDLADVDLILFDIQDVGVRFFTYISSLEDLASAAILHNKPLVVLDRPNPNGFYVDGPVLKPRFRSFLGMQEVPVVYGMTIGEYAKMLAGEDWIKLPGTGKRAADLQLTVIPCGNYTHSSLYELPVKPSPNLPDMASIYLYPSTCFFEGTALSEGRGTDRAFQVFGHPSLPDTLYSFTPRSREGAKNPKLLNQLCYGWDLGGGPREVLERVGGQIRLKWLIEAYRLFPRKDQFFINKGSTFNTLAGTEELMLQIRNGLTEEEIRESWQPGLEKFKEIRKKYLLYKDFE